MNRFPYRKIIWTLVIALFMNGYVLSVEGGDVTVTITNGTRHFLHVVINNEPFLYVAPGGSAQTETAFSTAYVEVFYSPGQGISGRAEKELTSTTTETYRSNTSNTCSDNSSSGCEINESDKYTASVTRSPMSWSVAPADLAADTTSISN